MDKMKSKKELKDSYKKMKFKIGVFQIRNIVLFYCGNCYHQAAM